VRVDQLTSGDVIRAANAKGELTTDAVSKLSLADSRREASFLTLMMGGAGRNITLTPEHHLPVGASCCSTLKQAKDIKAGETVWVVNGAGTATVATAVTKIVTRVKAKGLHSPVMTSGTHPVVDGVVTAFSSYGTVTLASYGLPFLEQTGLTEIFRRVASPKYIQ
jgi:hypothetical protein